MLTVLHPDHVRDEHEHEQEGGVVPQEVFVTTSVVADVIDIESEPMLVPLSTKSIVAEISVFQTTPDVMDEEHACSALVTAFSLPAEMEMPAPPVVHGSSMHHQSDYDSDGASSFASGDSTEVWNDPGLFQEPEGVPTVPPPRRS